MKFHTFTLDSISDLLASLVRYHDSEILYLHKKLIKKATDKKIDKRTKITHE